MGGVRDGVSDALALVPRVAAAVGRMEDLLDQVSRLLTRVLVPAVIVLAALGLLAFAARESLRGAIAVNVAPVVGLVRVTVGVAFTRIDTALLVVVAALSVDFAVML